MNDLTFFVKYRPLSPAAAVALCVLWAVASIWLTFMLLPVLVSTATLFKIVAWPVFGFIFVYVPYAIVSFCREGGMLAVTDEGISFPPSLLGLGPHQSFHWGSLKFVEYDDSRQRIQLRTEDGSRFHIDAEKISQSEAEQLMFAIEVLCPKASWSSPANDFKDGLQNAKLGIESDFTHMWEAELKRRYSVTTFAPHSPGVKLQNGRLTVLKQLAFGGFSAVYLAEDEDRRKVVVKELVFKNENNAEHAKNVEMFERESRLLARINHPNIVKVFDHFVEGNRHYLVLDFVDGENLRQLVGRKGPWSENEVITLAIKMSSILEDMHGLVPPLVHRDFTPDNLMVTAAGELTLVDFGAANECISAVTGTLVGKQSYMPIEQIRGKAEPRSDLYALGCTIYFLLTGNDPEPLSIISVPPTAAGEELRKIVEKLTQMEPEQRFSAASQVRSALSELSTKRNITGLYGNQQLRHNV